MSINFNDRNTEARMQKALSHFNSMVRPDKQKFVSEAINHYIDSLIKSKVIKKVWLVRETTDPDLKKGMVVRQLFRVHPFRWYGYVLTWYGYALTWYENAFWITQGV